MLLQVTRSPHATAGYSRLPKVTAGYPKLLQVTRMHCKAQLATGYWKLMYCENFLILILWVLPCSLNRTFLLLLFLARPNLLFFVAGFHGAVLCMTVWAPITHRPGIVPGPVFISTKQNITGVSKLILLIAKEVLKEPAFSLCSKIWP